MAIHNSDWENLFHATTTESRLGIDLSSFPCLSILLEAHAKSLDLIDDACRNNEKMY